jgi:predicted Zn-dependent protease
MSRSTLRMKALLAAAAACLVALTPVASHKASAQNLSIFGLRDTEIEKILRQDSDPILLAAGLEPKDVTIFMIGDKELNAGVAGGQNIMINTGLIIQTKTPNELAGVIAHEAGHIASAHLARRDEAIPGALATKLLTYGVGVLAAVASPDPRAGVSLLYSADYFAQLQLAKYTRIQESAADQAAAKFLETAGYSGKGLVHFFENFRSQEVFSEARRFAYFRSHPLSGDRIEALKMRVAASSLYEKPDSPEAIERHKIMVAKIRGFMNYPQQTFQDYPETDQSYPARYARAIAYFKGSDTPRAIKEVDALLAEQPNNPYLHELKGQIFFESGKVAESEAPYRRMIELAPNEPLLLSLFGQTLLAVKKPDEALPVLEKAAALDRDSPMTWRMLSEAYEAKGESGMARLAVAEQNFALGQFMEARQMGIRARELLEAGTPQHRRANDIVHAAEQDLMRRRRG